MKKVKRSDLACERAVNERTPYTIDVRELNGIECIYSVDKANGKIESITLCTGKIWRYQMSFLDKATEAVTKCISEIIKEQKDEIKSVLIVCLGNRSIGPDSLGPRVAEMLTPTKHLNGFKLNVGVLTTGVEGQSGFTSLDIVKAHLGIWEPDIILTIDSLYSRSIERLLSTVQISALGILPGSGVGNHKGEISMSTLKKPVISIGVPTVTHLFLKKYAKKADDVADFYISTLESDPGIDAYSKLLSRAVEGLYISRNIKK